MYACVYHGMHIMHAFMYVCMCVIMYECICTRNMRNYIYMYAGMHVCMCVCMIVWRDVSAEL